MLLLSKFGDGCNVGECVELVDRVSLGFGSLPWSLLQMLTWCLPLHLLHFIMERHSRLMWFFLKHTKHRPVLLKIYLSATSTTVLQEFEGWDCRQYEHLGFTDPLAKNELTVTGFFVVFLTP